MNTITKLLKSRTTYTVVAIAIVNTVPQIMVYLTPKQATFANLVLGFATLYFKLNPSQEYAKQ